MNKKRIKLKEVLLLDGEVFNQKQGEELANSFEIIVIRMPFNLKNLNESFKTISKKGLKKLLNEANSK